MATRAARSSKRQLFPEKLWDLVSKPDSGVQWSKDGTCIEVERTQLERSIGTKFRSQNFDSFIRQLHFYGFRKAGNSYYHEKFQQNQFQEVLMMKRKYSHMALAPISNNSTMAMVNATCQTSAGSAIGFSSDSGTESIAPITAIKQRKVTKPRINAAQRQSAAINYMDKSIVEGALDLRKSSRISNTLPAENRPVTSSNHISAEPQAIDYSKTLKRRLVPSAVKSPSKTLSKNQEYILVKVGPSS